MKINNDFFSQFHVLIHSIDFPFSKHTLNWLMKTKKKNQMTKENFMSMKYARYTHSQVKHKTTDFGQINSVDINRYFVFCYLLYIWSKQYVQGKILNGVGTLTQNTYHTWYEGAR